jgi:drug/metabolite transporter (DMT)-like permease
MTKTLTLLGICILTAVSAQVIVKVGLNRHGPVETVTSTAVLAVLREPLVLAGVALYALSALSWLIALSRVDLSFAYPLLTLSVVGVAWASKVFLGEPVSLLRLVGTLVTLGGAWLVVRS